MDWTKLWFDTSDARKLLRIHFGLNSVNIHLFAGMKAGWKERFQARREAFWRTGRFPKATKSDPWIPQEEKLLTKYSTADLLRIIRRTPRGIQARRISLGIRSLASPTRKSWKDSEIKLLGTDTTESTRVALLPSPYAIDNQWNYGN